MEAICIICNTSFEITKETKVIEFEDGTEMFACPYCFAVVENE